jgi:hypothetical protein
MIGDCLAGVDVRNLLSRSRLSPFLGSDRQKAQRVHGMASRWAFILPPHSLEKLCGDDGADFVQPAMTGQKDSRTSERIGSHSLDLAQVIDELPHFT